MSAEYEPSNFLPPIALSARSLARRTRRRKLIFTAIRLLLVTLGAFFGAITITGAYLKQKLDYAGVAGVLCFIAVLGVRMMMQSDTDPEDTEARANAIADLVTSHAWRYAIGARPYVAGTPELDRVAREYFAHNCLRYQYVLKDCSTAAIVSAQITAGMRTLRVSELEVRQKEYLTRRIEPLQASSGKSTVHLASRYRWLIALVLCVELLGIPGGVLKAVDVSEVDLLGVTGAAAASIALWVETLNLRERRRTAVALNVNLLAAPERLESAETEDEWAAMTAWIEEQLSLEQEALLAPGTVEKRIDPQIEDIYTMSAEEYFAAAATLRRQIWEGTAGLPKLEPDVIVAVNPGGAILGGILYFMTRASDFLPMSLRGSLGDEALLNMLEAAPWHPRQHHLSILLVDASVKSGGSLRKAIELVRKVVEARGFVAEEEGAEEEGTEQGVNVRRYVLRTAVIAWKADPKHQHPVKVDYYVNETTERFPYGTV